MIKVIFKCIFVLLCCHASFAQAVYVDSNTGNDYNNGTKEAPVFSIEKAAEIIRSSDNEAYTIKINPGFYILGKHIPVATEKEMRGKRITIEATVLPGDSSWAPEKMPVITSIAKRGDLPEKYFYIVSFLINESHVTIRGIKFTGYFNPHSRYYPIARLNKTKTDLCVEQCMFVGETDTSPLQVGVIAHGNEIKIDHCIFYKVRNAAVFFEPSEGNVIKNGNSITNSIIYGVNQAVWAAYPDRDFKFENNIVSNCRYVWVKDDFNSTIYSMNNCVVVNNKYYMGVPDNLPVNFTREEKLNLCLRPGKFEIKENNVTKEGQISLRLADTDDNAHLFGIDEPLPIDYMHVIPGTLGYDLGVGLFKF